nr:hypothetical protein [Tanacetum cinerariifolium]
MMIYLRNMAGFKMDYFKGMKYNDIHPIFEKYFNSIVAFLEKTREQIEEEENKAVKRISKSQEDKAAKKQKLDEEVAEKRYLQIVPNDDDDDDVYTEATPLALSKLRRLKRVGTSQRVDTSDDTVMDDVSKHGRIIADMDVDKDVTLKDVADIAKEVALDAEIDESADDDELEPTELQEVVEVVATAKPMTEVVTAANTPIPAATIPATAPTLTTAPSAARRRNGVVIRDLEETATPSIIIKSEAKSKDKGKGILVEEPKPL